MHQKNTMPEEWRPIVGLEDSRLVSNHGRVWRLARTVLVKHPNSQWHQHFPAKMLNPFPRTKAGYLCVKMRGRMLHVHHLVAEAFHGPRPEGYHCCHYDGVVTNNRADNLRWATPKENNRDQYRHGTRIMGEGHHKAKVTADEVREFRRLAVAGWNYRSIAEKFGTTIATVGQAVRRRTWRHVE